MRVSRQQAVENRQRVLDVAGSLFREKGFDGIGVADLMKAAGLTHGGFYGQFSSKDELAAEALAGVMDQAVGRWRGRAERHPEDPFAGIVGPYLSAAHRENVANGCPISALSGDVTRQADAVRTAYTDGIAALIDVLAETYGADAAARRKALATMASLAGAMMLARGVNDPALSDEIIAATREALGLDQKDRD